MTSLRLSCSTVLLCCYFVAWSDALDCRRFVFAPLCRGVSAKRSSQPSSQLSNFQNDYETPDEPPSTSDYKGAQAKSEEDEFKAANDEIVLYLLSQFPKLKSKSRSRAHLNDD